MKKWLIRCLTVLAMVCLIPGIVLNVKAADSIYTYCFVCMQQRNYEILGYTKVDSTKHRIHIKCSVCGRKNSIVYGDLSDHTGGTETPTCTTGKTCEKCGAEYGILGHKWKTPANASLGNGTHRIICLRCGLNGTASCTGGTATCTTKAVCEACGGKYGKRNLNNHALVHYDAQAPTCTKPGWDAFDTCPRCYYTTFRAIPALKHDLEHHEAKAPTCTEKGWDAYDTCSRCDYTTRKEIPALNHALEQHAAKAPTCTEIGWDAYETCSRCDYTTYAELPAQHDLRHHAAKAPTCTGIGWDAYDTCSRCDYTTTYVELPALNHALEQHEAQAPTCTEIGWDAYETCSRCDYTTYAELPAQHDLRHHAAKAPTCTGIGWDAYDTCSRCDYTTTYVELPALNHALEQHEAQAPTCTEIGWDAYETCSRCDYTTRKELPALNHDLEQYAAKAPTCTEIGWDAYETCSRCNHTTRTELPALNHDLKQHAAKAPTCTEIGWDAYETCSRCDYTTYAEQPALNHDFVQHEAKAPTCTEIGWDAYKTCSRCDYTTYAEQPALNHDLVQHDAQAPTCTEKGWDAYDTCSRCDYTTYAEQPALNHDLVQHAAKAPTCTEIGWDAYETCSRCDHTTYAELPALNHDYQAVTVEPTCEADGYTIFTCSRCKDSYTADPTDQLGHQFGAWSPNGTGSQSASCLRDGCAHTGSTDCRKFTFRTAEGETLTFCPVCGQAENAAQLEKIEAATAWANSGSLSAEDVTARTNGEYLSVAFETAGSLTQPTGRVRLALPAGLLEGKTLVRIAPDGTQTEMPFETERGTIILTLDFANSALPVMLFRLVPQSTAL